MKKEFKPRILLRFLLALVLISLLIPPVFTAEDTQTELKPQAETGSGFRFIVLGDVNPSANKQILNPRFQKALAGIPQHNPVFILHAGDMIGGVRGTSGAEKIDKMWDPFFGAIKAVTAANIPYIPSPGNHDAGMGNSQLKEGYRRNWIKDDRYPAPPYNAQGNYPYYYSFDFANNHFIILDTSKGKLGKTQIQWLAQDLTNVKNKDNIFSVMHVPFLSSGFGGNIKYGHSETAEKSALDMLVNAGAKILFAGHNHAYTEHTYKGARQITIGTAADDRRQRRGEERLKDWMFLVVDVLGKDNVKMYPAAMGSGFKNTLDGTPIPAAPTGAAPSFDPNSLMGQNCVPGTGDMSSLLSGDGIKYQSYEFKNGKFHVVTVDPNKFEIKVVTAKKATGKNAATLEDIVRNTPGAVAGINGGFFEGGGKPTNDIVEDGVMMKGKFNKFKHTFLNENGKYNVIKLPQLQSYGAEKIRTSVSSAMTSMGLVFNGNNVASTSAISMAPNPRSGVCITKEGAIKFLASQGIPKGSSLKGGAVSIKGFADEAINKHGCVMGINLDGGGSTSIEYHIKGQAISLKGERGAGGCKGRGFPCQRRVGDALVVVPKANTKPQVAGAPAAGFANPQTTPTGAFTAIDSITGFASDDTNKSSDSGNSSFTASPTTPVQQIGCMCTSGTQSSLVTPSSDKSSSYDFSNTEAATKGFGAKKDLSRIAKFEPYIQEASQKYGVPIEFIKGIIMVESDGKAVPSSTSRRGKVCDSSGKCICNYAGYCGLMQTDKGKCERTPECNWENFKKGDAGARDQIFTGAMFIKELMTRYKKYVGSPDSPDYFYWIAIGYNGGPGSAGSVREFAAQRLGIPEENVRWKDVTKEDTKKNQEKYFKKIPSKVDEVYYYPHKVMSVVEAVGGTQMMQQTAGMQCSYGYEFDYVSIGKYFINPSFTAEVDYNINHYNLITDKIKNMIARCSGKDSGSLRRCVKNAVKDAGYIDGGNIKLYNGPCGYAENMFSDLVEWTDACAKSSGTDCTCEIPLEYEYEKEDTDEEVIITASSNTITSSNEGVGQQSISGSVSGTKTIKTKTAAETYYAKKTGTTLTFQDSSSGKKCSVEKKSYKFCAETKKLYMVYDGKEKNLALKPIQYKFAVDFSEPAPAQPATT